MVGGGVGGGGFATARVVAFLMPFPRKRGEEIVRSNQDPEEGFFFHRDRSKFSRSQPYAVIMVFFCTLVEGEAAIS